MNPSILRTARRFDLRASVVTALAIISASATAQIAPAKRSASADSRTDAETVALNAFEVTADSDKSYGALNSNSITAFNLPIDRLPVTADIFNQTFMDEVGAINVEAALQAFDAGTQFGGLNTANASQNQP